MKRIAAAAIAITLLSFIPIAHNEATDRERQDGWVSLFDGKSFAGWHGYDKKPISKIWTIDNGAIHLDPSKRSGSGEGGDILTDKEYSNFDLKLEWKISKNGNSGIIFYVKEDPKYKEPWQTGAEMQVLDNDGHPDGKIKKHRAGDLYDLISSSTEPVKPVGEWNQAEIKSKDGKLELYLNDVLVVSTTLWNADWDNLVKGSKFKTMPGFMKFKSGRIDLQDHGNEVWFRNIKIKEL